MPVIVHGKVVDITVVAQRPFPLGPVQQTTENPQLQPIDKVVDAPVAQGPAYFRLQAVRIWSRSHSCSR